MPRLLFYKGFNFKADKISIILLVFLFVVFKLINEMNSIIFNTIKYVQYTQHLRDDMINIKQ